MTSRSFKYFKDKKPKPLRFTLKTVMADERSDFKSLWEETLAQSIDYKGIGQQSYDGYQIKTQIHFDEYPH